MARSASVLDISVDVSLCCCTSSSIDRFLQCCSCLHLNTSWKKKKKRYISWERKKKSWELQSVVAHKWLSALEPCSIVSFYELLLTTSYPSLTLHLNYVWNNNCMQGTTWVFVNYCKSEWTWMTSPYILVWQQWNACTSCTHQSKLFFVEGRLSLQREEYEWISVSRFSVFNFISFNDICPKKLETWTWALHLNVYTCLYLFIWGAFSWVPFILVFSFFSFPRCGRMMPWWTFLIVSVKPTLSVYSLNLWMLTYITFVAVFSRISSISIEHCDIFIWFY